MDVHSAIEKNRKALLRIVGCWLIAACLLPKRRNLPPRINFWIESLISKAELATHYLVIALTARLTPLGTMEQFRSAYVAPLPKAMNRRMLLSRLMRLRHKLLNLDLYAKRLARLATPSKIPAGFPQCTNRSQLNSVLQSGENDLLKNYSISTRPP